MLFAFSSPVRRGLSLPAPLIPGIINLSGLGGGAWTRPTNEGLEREGLTLLD